jgi:hypothetical protein
MNPRDWTPVLSFSVPPQIPESAKTALSNALKGLTAADRRRPTARLASPTKPGPRPSALALTAPA